MYETIKNERAILVVVKEQSEPWTKEMLLKEFEALVSSAGIEILDSVYRFEDYIWEKEDKKSN